MIVDCREYPNSLAAEYKLATYFIKGKQSFARFYINNITHPGTFLLPVNAYLTNDGPFFKGRVAILTDITTISRGEFVTMMYQRSPNDKVVGRNTAGADGDVTFVRLPGRIDARFSGTRVTYQDGTEVQRVGIQPDIIVDFSPTELINGKDAILERAIDYISQP